ncbi:Mannosyl-oligosaccharide 1,2-alpha-mannosidase MNS1 [Porphyridium purpureum]|uniref:alpha-1,2-Mannosidase n=1 Tax=Porphyridium purpureum TaxID=35688 RepID=A0A5J4Z3M3_PORPP|nr:Mannosyl-oligosaccharide 1,2-alpha-mannosidase MNS1 [Porphyridium purpureum]|eukprot:POR1741..scf295_1
MCLTSVTMSMLYGDVRLGSVKKYVRGTWFTLGSSIGYRSRAVVTAALVVTSLAVLLLLLNLKWGRPDSLLNGHAVGTRTQSDAATVNPARIEESRRKRDLPVRGFNIGYDDGSRLQSRGSDEVVQSATLRDAGKEKLEPGTANSRSREAEDSARNLHDRETGAGRTERNRSPSEESAWKPDLDRSRPFRQMTAETEDQEKIRGMIRFAWNSYASMAWGMDLLLPLEKKGSNSKTFGGQAASIIDAIDTLYLVGMHDEFEKARHFILNELVLDKDVSVQFFENVIRILGGLLGAYTVTGGDTVFLEKAKEVGYRLLPALEKSHSGWPYKYVNLHSGEVSGDNAVVAEAMVMEFRFLAQVTGEERFAAVANRVICLAQKTRELNGLYRGDVSAHSEAMRGDIVFGPNGDSWYEYLLKMWVQTGMAESVLREMYMRAADSMIREHSVSLDEKRSYIADTVGYSLVRLLKQGVQLNDTSTPTAPSESYKRGPHFRPSSTWFHLGCFLPGMFALGYGLDRDRGENASESHMTAARKVLNMCSSMYTLFSAHLAPNSVNVRGDVVRVAESFSCPWPEHVESLFVLSRVFWDERETFRAEGRRIYQAMEEGFRVDAGGYAGLSTVHGSAAGHQSGPQDTWVLAETFKYLYLLFSEDRDFMNPLSNVFVLNTEAHPLLIVPENPYPIVCQASS